MITINDYLTSSGKYPERAKSPECTSEVIKNAEALLKAVNALLEELNIKNIKVSSGFRTSAANGTIKNAAKASLHMLGRAIDLVDFDGKLDALISNKDNLTKRFGLWQEHPDSTPGWCHLDNKDRGPRAKNVFIP